MFCAKQFTGKMEWQTNLEKSWIGCSDCILITKIFYREVSVHRGQDPEHGLLLRQSYAMSYSMFMPWLWLCYETSGYNMILNSFHRLSGCMPRGPPLGLKRPWIRTFQEQLWSHRLFHENIFENRTVRILSGPPPKLVLFQISLFGFCIFRFFKKCWLMGYPREPPPGNKRPRIRAFQNSLLSHWNFYEKIFKNKKVRVV